jgi:SAM-dependent methyltransferase
MDMQNINAYWRVLTGPEIEAKTHRNLVGGLWDGMGAWQLEAMMNEGLHPSHRLLDIGCGALRGGVRLIPYLDDGNYYGLDINASLIAAGRLELEALGMRKSAHLLVDDGFDASRFGVTFDYGLAQSVFTHLYANLIVRCLVQVRRVLTPAGRIVATFYAAPHPGHIEPIQQAVGPSFIDRDPYHYSVDEMESFGRSAGLCTVRSGICNHPRGQRLIVYGMPD